MEELTEQIIGEVKLAQMRAGDVSDYELAKRVGLSASAYSVAKHSGFGLELLAKVAKALGRKMQVNIVEGRLFGRASARPVIHCAFRGRIFPAH